MHWLIIWLKPDILYCLSNFLIDFSFALTCFLSRIYNVLVNSYMIYFPKGILKLGCGLHYNEFIHILTKQVGLEEHGYKYSITTNFHCTYSYNCRASGTMEKWAWICPYHKLPKIGLVAHVWWYLCVLRKREQIKIWDKVPNLERTSWIKKYNEVKKLETTLTPTYFDPIHGDQYLPGTQPGSSTSQCHILHPLDHLWYVRSIKHWCINWMVSQCKCHNM